MVVLDQDRNDPTRDVIEVYDNPHPSPRHEGVLTVEALASWPWIMLAEVGSRNRRKDRLDVIEQPRTAALGQMKMRAGVEHDAPAIRVDDALLLMLHAVTLRAG